MEAIPRVSKNYDDDIHSSIELISTQASKKPIENELCKNKRDNRQKKETEFTLGDSERTSILHKTFYKGNTSNWSYVFSTILHKF